MLTQHTSLCNSATRDGTCSPAAQRYFRQMLWCSESSSGDFPSVSEEPDMKPHRAPRGGIYIDFPNLRRYKKIFGDLLVPYTFTFSDGVDSLDTMLLTFEKHSKRNRTYFY